MTTLLMLILIGLIAGTFSGLFGVGGGVVIVPLLVFALGLTQHQAQGMSLAVLAVPVTFIAAYSYHTSGDSPLNFKYAFIIAVCFVVGAYFGSKIAININEILLKKLFAVLLILIAIKMFFSK